MTRLVLLSIAIVLAALAGIHAQNPLERFTYSEPIMGTTFRIILYAPDEDSAQKAAGAAFQKLRELDQIMSDYKKDSELMKLCERAGGEAVKVSRELFDILEKSQEFAQETAGALDITLGPVIGLWRKARKTRELPNPQELAQALRRVGYKNLVLDAKNRTVRLLLMGMLLDLGAIGKGYAGDLALAVLRSHGMTRALIVGGGDVQAGDPPPGQKGWKVGVAPLKEKGEPSIFLVLANQAVSTSGDLYQFVEIAGKRYSHIVDPRTGMGLEGRLSVTVIAPTGTTADGLDTACCVLGKEKALELIERKNLAALIMQATPKGVEITRSKRFSQFESVD